ncbi:hypothetical protein RJ639_044125 [Escallonia herrerae]|uniref:GBF-interacting protein 1 N-terminal domain-containing protein n=1 Tax=Escallonia herrerae TaxID=1293975 RepID=A0AA88WE82_9ASTE|nr:hypothetical protein RJ639_044125 [Escallonia herrerae]
MSGRVGRSTGGGPAAGTQSIPAASRKMVQSLKEIVNSTEAEIYAMLKECNMDPNEAVNRLLAQDPFHEVKSKREKKKENKDTSEARPRGASSTSNRGPRSGTDRYAGRGASGHLSFSESGAVHSKPAYKKENGTNPYTSSSYPAVALAGSTTNRRPQALSDSVSTENQAYTIGVPDGVSLSSQPSSGYQPAWVGVPGQKSMADIVKMGRPQNKALITANLSNHHQVYAAPDQHVSPEDEWPLIEHSPAASVPPFLEPHADTELHQDQQDLQYDRINQPQQSETEEVHVAEDNTTENSDANHVENDSAGAPLYDNVLYKDMGSYDSHNHAFEHQEVEDGGISSATANFEQLSLQNENQAAPAEDDGPTVKIPNHLQVQTADCAHLSFGSFGAAITGPFGSNSLRSNVEDPPSDEDASPVGHPDTRDVEYYGDDSLRTTSEGNLVHRTVVSAGGYDSPSASQPDVLKLENHEVAHESQYNFPSTAPGYTFENAQQLNSAFAHSQTSSQMQNLTPFSSVMPAYTNSLPTSLLAADAHPVRESDPPYSPFPMTQSMPTKYGNTVSSISGSTISMSEALKTVGYSSTQPTPQTLPGTSVATGPTLPQHLAVHPYSQPTLPLGPFANMISYPFLPQSYTYMPSGFQQAFAGNNSYHQSLAAVLPQYKNSVAVSSLPQSAGVASGYGNFGSSNTIPGNYPMNQPAGPAGTAISYDEVLSSQYKDSNHLMSLQQNENSAMWLHGPGSRTMSAIPASTYYSFQGQNQQPGGYRQGQQPSQSYGSLAGYPNYYHSQTGISLEHQPQNPRDGSLSGSQGQPKQSQQIWQNSY